MCSVELFYMLRLHCCCCRVVKKNKITDKPFNLFEVKCRQQQGFLATLQRLLQILLMAGLILGDKPVCFYSTRRGDGDQDSNFPLGWSMIHWRTILPGELGCLEGEMPGNAGPATETVRWILGQIVLVVSALYLHLPAWLWQWFTQGDNTLNVVPW